MDEDLADRAHAGGGPPAVLAFGRRLGEAEDLLLDAVLLGEKFAAEAGRASRGDRGGSGGSGGLSQGGRCRENGEGEGAGEESAELHELSLLWFVV